MATPTSDQIQQAQSNVNNLMDWINHVHDYLQDIISEVYNKLSEDTSYDPTQKFVTNIMDSALWSIGSMDFPGAGIASSFLGTFFGSYSGPNSPPSLNGTFGDVWDRFDKTFLQANTDLAVIHADIAGNWNNTYTNPVNNAVGTVSDLGTGTVTVPGKDDPLFQTMTNTAVAAYKVSLTKQTIGSKWHVLQDPNSVFEAWSQSQLLSWTKGTFMPQNPSYMVTAKADQGGSIVSPQNGYDIFENFLGSGSSTWAFAGQAPSDLCNWLFQDDGFGTTTNSNGIAQRRDVFYNWGLSGSLSAASQAIDDTTAARSISPADQLNAASWVQRFNQSSRQQVEQQIIVKAQQDPTFRDQLLSDPKTALVSLLGLTLPDFISLEVIPETPDTFIMALPVVGTPDASQVEPVTVGAWPDLFSQTSRQEVEKQIILKSGQDVDFLRGLVRNPKATLEGFLGITFPDSVQVKVIQETPDKYKLVLPLLGAPDA